MKAVLLAAGLGSRLRPLTDATPKCLVPVAGKPVIQHDVEWLRGQGVCDLAVNVHHHSAAVQEFLGSGEHLGVSVRYSYEEELLGTAGAVGRLRDWVGDEDFLVVYADNILFCDLAAMARRHRELAATATVALFWREDVTASGVADVNPDGSITGFVEKPSAGEVDSHWVNAGLLRCDPRVLRFIPTGFSDFGRDVLPALLAAEETVAAYPMSGTERLHW
nr:nucleotidyltransferase family protein [Actinomycetota bacterium]